ncbi:MAG: glycosyltransferase [Beijerinckiaceae bacterium]|nr:glycosyltransferase [Beijerinckiaceae bacterium]
MPKRTFLFYMPALIGGGAERVWALLASEFARRGHDVLFVVDYEAEENKGFLDPRVRRLTLPRTHFGATLGLLRLLRRERPDVSLSGLGVANLKHMIAAFFAGHARRAIISYHGFFASENRLLSRLGNHGSWLFTRLCGRAIAVSDGLRNTLIEQHHASPRRTIRIYNPVFSPADITPVTVEDLAKRPPHLLFVGRMHPDKDLATLVSAFAAVKTPGARLELVGDGPQRAALEAQVKALGLTDRVTFSGYLADPTEAYARARCLVLTSRLESFGNVVAEGLAHGLPVVSTAAAGPLEILDQGRFGAIVPIGDVPALAKALDAALADPGDPVPRIARAALFSIDKATDAYLAAAEAVITESPAAGGSAA